MSVSGVIEYNTKCQIHGSLKSFHHGTGQMQDYNFHCSCLERLSIWFMHVYVLIMFMFVMFMFIMCMFMFVMFIFIMFVFMFAINDLCPLKAGRLYLFNQKQLLPLRFFLSLMFMSVMFMLAINILCPCCTGRPYPFYQKQDLSLL